jgi:pimeloyl-ACP methyl ester carboxylesterase
MPRQIVIIHGAFAGGWCFENFAGAFEHCGWTCHAPDLRLHGREAGEGVKAKPDARLAGTSIADYTDDIARFIASLDEPPFLIGHSMGGIISQQLAAKGLARAVVLLASGAPWGILPSSDEERAVATGLMSAGRFWTEALTPVFEVAARDSLANLDEGAKRRVFDKLGPESERAIFLLDVR